MLDPYGREQVQMQKDALLNAIDRYLNQPSPELDDAIDKYAKALADYEPELDLDIIRSELHGELQRCVTAFAQDLKTCLIADTLGSEGSEPGPPEDVPPLV